MEEFFKRNKIVLVICGFLLVVLPLAFWSFRFMLKRIQAKADSAQEKVIDNNLEKLKIEKIPEMEKIDAEFEKNKVAIETILKFENKVEFIEYVENLAQETNNKVELKVLADSQVEDDAISKAKTKTVAKKKEAEKKTIEDSLRYKQYITMQIDLEGDYAGFLNFVHKLENNKYYANILSFNLQKVFVKKGESEKSNSSFDGVYFYPSQKGASSNAGIDSEGEPKLKSSLNIIVYVE